MLFYHLSVIQIDKAMMDELKEVKKAVNPTEVLLVVDAMTGQEAAGIHLLLLPAISVLLPSDNILHNTCQNCGNAAQ